jgi:hypothetical protein
MICKYFLAASLLALFIACNSRSEKGRAAMDVATRELRKAPESDIVMADSVSGGTAAGNNDQPEQQPGQNGKPSPAPAGSPQANPDWDKKIVKTANIHLEVRHYQSFGHLLHEAVRRSGGYVSQEEQSQSEYKTENNISIKVPVDQFDELVSALTSAGDSNKVMEKKISAEDVTMEVVDTRSRVEAKREVRARYLELLKQAHTMEEILKVQHEINDIQEQIEAASGRIGYLSHSAAFSTINLNYYQILDPGAKSDPEPSFFHRLKDAAGEGWRWVGELVIGLTGMWPLWLVGILSWLGIRRWRSSYRARRIASRPA